MLVYFKILLEKVYTQVIMGCFIKNNLKITTYTAIPNYI